MTAAPACTRAPTRYRRQRSFFATALVLCALSACGQIVPRFGTLDGVVVGGASAPIPAPAEVRIARPEGTANTIVGMAINKQDTISTSMNARARLTLLQSYEVTLDTGTVIVIENPSIFVKIGRLFIRKLTGGPDTAVVHTNHTTILDRSTAFFVSVPREDRAQVIVAEGSVTVFPRVAGRWPPETYRQAEGGTYEGTTRGRRMEITPRILASELRWVREVDSLTRRRIVPDGRVPEGRVPDIRVRDSVPPAPPPIILRPGRGESTRVCRVPDIRNLSEVDALKRLSDSGYVGRRRGNRADYVATQTPAAGDPACGGTITYTMAVRIL